MSVSLSAPSIADQNAGIPVPVTDYGGRVRQIVATIEVTNGNAIGSTFRMARLRSNWRISMVRLFCDAITSAAADIGLYQTAANGGAVVDVDAYASAQSLATASLVGIETMFEARNIDKVANRVWQDAGLSADSQRDYDLVLTLTAAATATGTVSIIVEYVID